MSAALPAHDGGRERPHLSLVLPAYNEQGNIERAVREAASAAAALAADYELVVVDDGSRDGTAGRLEELQAELGHRLQVVRHPVNRGYGAALRSGFRAARGELVFYTDSDNQFDLEELGAFMPLMAECDAVVGYRARRKDPPLRLLTSRVFNCLAAWTLGLRVRDVNCSFKLFRGDLLRSLPLVSDDFMIDAELVARLQRDGVRVLERGVTHRPRAAGRSTVRPWHVPRTLASLARLWRHLRRDDDGLAGRDAGARWRAAMRRPAVALLPAVLGGLAALLVATPEVILIPGTAPARRMLFGVPERGAIGQTATILVPGVARHRGFEVRLHTTPLAVPAALTAEVNGGPPSPVRVPPHGRTVILVPPSTGAGLRLELRRAIPGPLVRVQRIVIRTPGSRAWGHAFVVAALAFVGTWLLLRRWPERSALALGGFSAGLLALAAAPAVLFMMLPTAGALTRSAAPVLLLVSGGVLLCRVHRAERLPALRTAVLIAGIVFGGWARASLIVTSGSWDTEYWKAWMLRAESHGLARVYGEPDAVGPGHFWAQVRRQEPRWEAQAFGRSFGVDYPPLAMASWRLSLAAARRVPGLDDRERLNVAAKLPSLAGDVLACALLLWTLRRAPRRAATLATLYWALPISWVSSAALGFMDGAYTPVLAAALVAAGLGRAGPAGALLAVSALLKLTSLVALPAAVAALLAARRSPVPAALGGACVAAIVFAPFLAAGTIATAFVHVYSILFQDRLSAGWANAWWLLGWGAALRGGTVRPQDQVPFVPISVLPLPAQALGALLFACAAAWVFWRQRRCPGAGPALLAGGALVLAYAGLATGVHENHPHPALFLLLATGLRTTRLRWLTGAIALTYLLNLLSLSGLGRFHGLGLAAWPLVGEAAGRLRMLPGFDMTLALAVVNTALLALVLARLPADLAAHAESEARPVEDFGSPAALRCYPGPDADSIA